MSAPASNSSSSNFQQSYSRYQGCLDGSSQAETMYYTHNRGAYSMQLYSCFPKTNTRNEGTLPYIRGKSIAITRVMEFLGVNHESSLHHVAHVTLLGLEELSQSVHSLFRAMITCEHRKEVAAGWTGSDRKDLQTRLTALDEGQKALKGYLEQKIVSLYSRISDTEYNHLTRNQLLSARGPCFSIEEVAHLLTLITNFGSEPLKNKWHEAIQYAQVNGGKIPFGELFPMIDQGYEVPVEGLVDLLAQEIVAGLLPHLNDVKELTKRVDGFSDRLNLLFVGGKPAYERALSGHRGEIELLNAIRKASENFDEEHNLHVTCLLLPQQIQGCTHTQIIESAHPLAGIAFRVSSGTKRMQCFKELMGETKVVSLKTSANEARAILIPTEVIWVPAGNPPTEKDMEAASLFADPVLKGKMEEAYKLGSALIEKDLNETVQEASTYVESYKRQCAKFGEPLDAEEILALEKVQKGMMTDLRMRIPVIRKYRDALLYTVLAGIKKQRAGTFKLYPSHFHEEFTQIFVKGLVGILASTIKEHVIKPIRLNKAIHPLDHAAEVIPALTKSFKSMEEQFTILATKK